MTKNNNCQNNGKTNSNYINNDKKQHLLKQRQNQQLLR